MGEAAVGDHIHVVLEGASAPRRVFGDGREVGERADAVEMVTIYLTAPSSCEIIDA